MDAELAYEKNARRELHKKATSYIEQILEQHPTKQQLNSHLPPISKTILIRRTRYAGHCRRSKEELITDVLLWTPSYGQASIGRPTRIYLQQLRTDKLLSGPL